MKTTVHIRLNGNAAEAIRFYEKHLGARLEFKMNYADAPGSCGQPAEFADRILHSSVKIGDLTVMICDCPPDKYERAAGFSLSLTLPDEPETQRVWDSLTGEGKASIDMPIEKTFWSPLFGMATDPFGIQWMVGCEAPVPAQV